MKEIEIKNLNFSYEDTGYFLKDVSFSIEKGEFVALIGHNGSGKSTLAKIIAGLLPFKSGQIIVKDIELNKANLNKIRPLIGLIFQNPDNQFVGTTVEEDIAFGLENRCVSRDKMPAIIHHFASLVGMESYLNKEAANLSGGQKQRVALASTFALNPEILILDEACSMLDPKGKRDINNLINEMRQNNPDLTIISITHDVEETYLADKVIVLEAGRVIKQASPIELFQDDAFLKQHNLKRPFNLEFIKCLKEAGFDVDFDMNLEGVIKKLCPSK